MSKRRDYIDTYESILGEIIAGRKATHELVDGVIGDGDKHGKELRDYHEQIQGTDTSQPGWVARLLGRG